MSSKPYEDLQVAIVESACNSYIESKMKLYIGENKYDKNILEDAKNQIDEDINFFKSKWGKYLLGAATITPDKIINVLDNRIIDKLKGNDK